MKISLCSILLLLAIVNAPAQVAPQHQISVSGSAEVKAVPDEVRINVGVETRSATLDPARLENDQKIAQVLSFLRESGIKECDMQTDYINIQPDYDYNQSRIKPVAYIVRKNIEIRLTDPAKFQNILTGMLTNGVNNVNEVNFQTTKLRQYRDQARVMAIRAAKEKATLLTAELGVKLGRVDNINVNDYGNPWGGNYYRNSINNSVQNVQYQNEGSHADVSESSANTFAAGEISLSATVSVVFEIK